MNEKPSSPQKRKGWDERYATEDYLFGTEPNDFLKSVAEKIPASSKVLCLADGEGRNGVFLASLGHSVTSVDMSLVGLQKAQQLAARNDVPLTTIHADLTEYDLGSSRWDCIVSIFFHIPKNLQDIIYPRLLKSLRPGGHLIIESYTPRQLTFNTGGPPLAEYMLTMELIKSAFEDLLFLHAAELDRQVIEGAGHTGQAAVLQLLAQKPA